MLNTPADLVAHIRRVEQAVSTSTQVAVNAAATRAIALHLLVLDSMTSGRKLRGVGKNGAKLGVSLSKMGSGSHVVSSTVIAGINVERVEGSSAAVLKATGPWQLIEKGTKAHQVTSKYANAGVKGKKLTRGQRGDLAGAGISVGGRRAVLNIPGIGYRRYAKVRGAPGKHPWRIGRELAERVIPQEMTKASLAAVRKLYTG